MLRGRCTVQHLHVNKPGKMSSYKSIISRPISFSVHPLQDYREIKVSMGKTARVDVQILQFRFYWYNIDNSTAECQRSRCTTECRLHGLHPLWSKYPASLWNYHFLYIIWVRPLTLNTFEPVPKSSPRYVSSRKQECMARLSPPISIGLVLEISKMLRSSWCGNRSSNN